MSLMPTITHPYSPASAVTASSVINTTEKKGSEESQALVKPSLESRTSSFAKVVLTENGVTRVLEGKEAEDYTVAAMADVITFALFLGALGCLFSDPNMVTYFEDQAKLQNADLDSKGRVEELTDLSLEKPKATMADAPMLDTAIRV